MNRSDDNVIKFYNEILEEACQKGAGQKVKNYEDYEKMAGSTSKRRVKEWLALNMSRPEFQDKIKQLNSLMGTSTAFRDKRNKIDGRNEREMVEKFLSFGESLKPKAPVVTPSVVPAASAGVLEEEQEKDKEKEKEEQEKKEEEKEKDKKDDDRKVEKLKGKAKKSLSDSWKSFKKRVSNTSVWLSLASAICFAISASVGAPGFTLAIFAALPVATVTAKTASYILKMRKSKREKAIKELAERAKREAKIEENDDKAIKKEKVETPEVDLDKMIGKKTDATDPDVKIDVDKFLPGIEKKETKAEGALPDGVTPDMPVDSEYANLGTDALKNKIGNEQRSLAVLMSLNANGSKNKEIEDAKEKIKNMQRELSRRKNKRASIHELEESLVKEKEKLNYWKSLGREDAIKEIEKNIKDLELKICSRKNAKNLAETSRDYLNHLKERLDYSKKLGREDWVKELTSEIEEIQNSIISDENSKNMQNSYQEYLIFLKNRLQDSENLGRKDWIEDLNKEIIDVQTRINTEETKDLSNTLEALERGKNIAIRLNRKDLLEGYEKEIEFIKNNNRELNPLEEAKTRVSLLENAKNIAWRLNKKDMITSYNQELGNLDTKYNLGLNITGDSRLYNPYSVSGNKEDKEEGKNR